MAEDWRVTAERRFKIVFLITIFTMALFLFTFATVFTILIMGISTLTTFVFIAGVGLSGYGIIREALKW